VFFERELLSIYNIDDANESEAFAEVLELIMIQQLTFFFYLIDV